MRITSINRVCFLFNHMFFKGTYFLEGKATEDDRGRQRTTTFCQCATLQ